MNVNGPSPAASAIRGPEVSAVDKRAQLQTMLLKKALDAQQGESSQMLRQVEGKGQNLDLRV